MERYYAEKGNYGYVIRDSEKLLPLPFFILAYIMLIVIAKNLINLELMP